jgi:hypothetical protein
MQRLPDARCFSQVLRRAGTDAAHVSTEFDWRWGDEGLAIANGGAH